MIVVGVIVVAQMMPLSDPASFTGIVLGLAMIALGDDRLRALFGDAGARDLRRAAPSTSRSPAR